MTPFNIKRAHVALQSKSSALLRLWLCHRASHRLSPSKLSDACNTDSTDVYDRGRLANLQRSASACRTCSHNERREYAVSDTISLSSSIHFDSSALLFPPIKPSNSCCFSLDIWRFCVWPETILFLQRARVRPRWLRTLFRTALEDTKIFLSEAPSTLHPLGLSEISHLI